MEQLSRKLPLIKVEPQFNEKVIMFGEGAFLRAFACYAVEMMNRRGLFSGGVTIVQPIPVGKIKLLEKQDGLFTVIERGAENKEKVVKETLITCVNDYINPYEEYEKYISRARSPELRFIISDTTEAGISYREGEQLSDKPQVSFAGKITAFLYERYSFFKGDERKGLIFLPCELIENNGTKLKSLVQKYAAEWNLEEGFIRWVNVACIFANTLVDRITAGYPDTEARKICEELGYHDELLDACELFWFWAIEGTQQIKEEFPLEKAGLNAVFSDNIAPYRLRKERLLNGAQTCLAPAALLCGMTSVGEAMSGEIFRKYIERALFSEIIPTLEINKNALEVFARSVMERFCNPFIEYKLKGITPNSVTKFNERILPAILEYQRRYGGLPPYLTFSFAALIAFYKNGGRFKIADEERNIAFLRDNSIAVIFKNAGAWGVDLSENQQLLNGVVKMFGLIKEHGIKAVISRLVED